MLKMVIPTLLMKVIIMLLFIIVNLRFMKTHNDTSGTKKYLPRDDHSSNMIQLPPRTVKYFNLCDIIGDWYEVFHSNNLDEVWSGSLANRTCVQASFKPLTTKAPTSITSFLRFQLYQNTVNIWNGILTRKPWETVKGKLILQEKGIESKRRFHIYIVAFEISHPGYLALSDPLGIHLQVVSRSKQFSVSEQSRVLRRQLDILGFIQDWNKPRLTNHENCTYHR